MIVGASTSPRAGKTLTVALLVTRLILLTLFCAVLLFLFPGQAHADGGAPNLAYVAGTARGISTIDIAQQKVTATLNVPGDPHTIYLSVDGQMLYVTQPQLGQVSVIATKTKQVICTATIPGQPTLLTLDPGINTLYAAGNGADSVSALNPTTCAVVRTLTVSRPVQGLAVAIVGAGIAGGTGNQLWVADAKGLTVFDSAGKVIISIPVPDGPQYLTIPSGPTVYMTTSKGTVEAVDLSTYHLLPALLTGGSHDKSGSYYGSMDYDASTGEVYVPDMQHNLIDVLSPVNAGAVPAHEPDRVIHLNASPQSIAVTSDGQFGFVALANGTVAMLDIPGHQLITTIPVGGAPHFIITGLYPSLISLTPQQSILASIITNGAEYAASGIILLVAIVIVLRSRRWHPQ